MERAAVQPLLSTDHAEVTMLHLDAGGSTTHGGSDRAHLVVVVSGTGTVDIGADSTAVRTGEAVRAPAETPLRLRTDEGVTVLLVEHPEHLRSWRVSRVDEQGRRWVAGVFDDTERARQHRDRLRAELPPGESAVMD